MNRSRSWKVAGVAVALVVAAAGAGSATGLPALSPPRPSVAAPGAVGASGASAPLPDVPGGSGERSCGWPAQITANQVNAMFPDEGAKYWVGALPIPQGGHLEIAGQYPHARYTSLITYNPQTAAIDGLNDQQIQPDAGSTDPFLPGANRNATRRDYTVSIYPGAAPANRPANTIYTSNADGSKTSGPIAIYALRIYVPDNGGDIMGGVPLPKISVVTSMGQKITVPDCPLNGLPDSGLAQTLAASGGATALPPLGTFGDDPIVWHKFVNLATGVANGYLDNSRTGAVAGAVTPITSSKLPTGGFLENIDNKYIYTNMDTSYGQVLVLHGKAPTAPKTADGEPTMPTGQLRYWSMCTESIQTTAFYKCAYDEQIPLDSNGYYTIVISTAAARPATATAACGITWLPAGPSPQTLLLMRNMLPSPSFKEAIQNVRPGFEQQDMGAYYPVGTYYANAEAFAEPHCGGDHGKIPAATAAPNPTAPGSPTNLPRLALPSDRPALPSTIGGLLSSVGLGSAAR